MDLLGPFKAQRYLQLVWISVSLNCPLCARRQHHLTPANVDHHQALHRIAAKRTAYAVECGRGDTMRAQCSRAVTVALANPSPHHFALVSIAAKAPPSLAPLALERI